MGNMNASVGLLLAACCFSAALAISVPTEGIHGRIGGSIPDQSSNEVRALPGYRQQLPSKHYSGYIDVGAKKERHLFYYLVQSEVPSNVLLLWLTGGPGCSSLDAFTYEHGPLLFSFKQGADAHGQIPTMSDIELNPNPHSWSKTASVLYIDSPAGTGFSYADKPSGYVTNDTMSIDDLEAFVAKFFQQYPQLRQLQLYTAGESYAGVYVPLLTQRLLQHNQRLHSSGSSSSSSRPYNLAGYIVGNAVTDDAVDYRGQVDYAYNLGLVDPGTYKQTLAICEDHNWKTDQGTPCGNAMDMLEAAMGAVNQYDITAPCFQPAAAAARRASSSSSSSSSGMLRHTISCADRRHALIYYNSAAVRAAIHAGSLEQAGRWEPCSDVLHYTHTAGSMIPVHRELVAAGLRALVYSGTADYVVPFTGSRAWVYGLGLKEAKPWGAWSMPGSQQVSGHTVQFKQQQQQQQQRGGGGLTFATVLGGGHMVPQTHPQQALALLQLWLTQQL
ncbi:hypothetical protein OEZ86_007312 [Tetradesmus obliquus]|nr:hypothetical protein OEZ86_007312 [Tetradesmus obliquus]